MEGGEVDANSNWIFCYCGGDYDGCWGDGKMPLVGVGRMFMRH